MIKHRRNRKKKDGKELYRGLQGKSESKSNLYHVLRRTNKKKESIKGIICCF